MCAVRLSACPPSPEGWRIRFRMKVRVRVNVGARPRVRVSVTAPSPEGWWRSTTVRQLSMRKGLVGV